MTDLFASSEKSLGKAFLSHPQSSKSESSTLRNISLAGKE
jgi:hypothetical protein